MLKSHAFISCQCIQYRQFSNVSHTLVGNKIIDQSDVGAVGAAPTTSSFST